MTQDNIRKSDVKTLISLCSIDVVNKEKLHVDHSLIQLGKKHGVGPWCYCQMINQSESHETVHKSLTTWKNNFHETSRNNQTKLGVFLSIQEHLLHVGIPILALRGFAMSVAGYEDLGNRPFGNLDVLVPEGKAMLALSTLVNAGAHTITAPRSDLHEQLQAHVRIISYQGVQIVIYQRLFDSGSPFHLKVNLFKHAVKFEKEGYSLSLLNDLFLGYHLIAYVASCIDNKRIRLGWLLDIAQVLHKQKNPASFLDQIKKLNPSQGKLFDRVFQLALLFIPEKLKEFKGEIPDEDVLLDDLVCSMKRRRKSDHQKIHLKEVMKVNGMHNKAGLLWHELFPSREYMTELYQREDKVMVGLYLKRFLGI